MKQIPVVLISISEENHRLSDQQTALLIMDSGGLKNLFCPGVSACLEHFKQVVKQLGDSAEVSC